MAEAVLIAARGDRRRVLVTAHAALGDLVARTDEVIGSDVTTRIRDLQAEGEGVLLISAGDDAALDAADVGVGYLHAGPEGGACWTADIICGPGLTEVWRLLRAAGAARSVSQRSVTIAASGATLGLLVATVGRVGRGRQGISLPVSPVQAASTASLLQGAYAARRARRDGTAHAGTAHRLALHAADEVLRKLAAEHAEDEAADAAGRDQPPLWSPGRWGSRLGSLEVPAGLSAAADLGRAVFDELNDPLTPVLLIGSAASALLGSAVDAALVGGVMVGNAVAVPACAAGIPLAGGLRELLLQPRVSGPPCHARRSQLCPAGRRGGATLTGRCRSRDARAHSHDGLIFHLSNFSGRTWTATQDRNLGLQSSRLPVGQLRLNVRRIVGL